MSRLIIFFRFSLIVAYGHVDACFLEMLTRDRNAYEMLKHDIRGTPTMYFPTTPAVCLSVSVLSRTIAQPYHLDDGVHNIARCYEHCQHTPYCRLVSVQFVSSKPTKCYLSGSSLDVGFAESKPHSIETWQPTPNISPSSMASINRTTNDDLVDPQNQPAVNWQTDPKTCLALCRLHPLCNVVTYRALTRRCWLKRLVTRSDDFKLQHSDDRTTWVEQSLVRKGPAPFVLLDGIDYPYGDLLSVRVSDGQTDCVTLCALHRRCTIVTYGPRQGVCWLKQADRQQGFGFRSHADHSSWVQTEETQQAYFKKHDSMDYPQGNLFAHGEVPVIDGKTDADTCLTLCTLHPTCRIVSYSRTRARCWLKRKAAVENGVNGLKAHVDVTTWVMHDRRTHEYEKRPISFSIDTAAEHGHPRTEFDHATSIYDRASVPA